MPINVFLWKASKEDIVLANKIILAIGSQAGIKLSAKTDDLSVVEAATQLETPCLSFGDMANRQYSTSGSNWVLPDISKLRNIPENTSIRHEAFQKMKEIGEQLVVIAEQEREPTNSHVEMANGVTVGKTCTDISISKEEASYLKQLKELLGGSKIVITKGDTRIEVE